MKTYDVEDITKKLNKELAEDKIRLAAWEAVTFPTKKDGSPYKAMNKNIEGAKYKPWEYSIGPGQYELTVYGKENGVYASDSMSCYESVKYLKDEKKLAKVENLQPKQGDYCQVYTYDLEDIKEAVAARISYLREHVKSLESQLEVIATAYDTFYEKVHEAKQELIEVTGKNTSLYYEIINHISTDLNII